MVEILCLTSVVCLIVHLLIEVFVNFFNFPLWMHEIQFSYLEVFKRFAKVCKKKMSKFSLIASSTSFDQRTNWLIICNFISFNMVHVLYHNRTALGRDYCMLSYLSIVDERVTTITNLTSNLDLGNNVIFYNNLLSSCRRLYSNIKIMLYADKSFLS